MRSSSPSSTPQWFSDNVSEGSVTEVIDDSSDELEGIPFGDPDQPAPCDDGSRPRLLDPPLQPEEVVRGCAICNASAPGPTAAPHSLANPILVRSAADAVAALSSFVGAADNIHADHVALQAVHRQLHEHAVDLHRHGTAILRQGEDFAWYCDQRLQRTMMRLTESSAERRRLEEVVRDLEVSLEDARAGRDRADALQTRLATIEAVEHVSVVEEERLRAYMSDLESRVVELEQRRRQFRDNDQHVNPVWVHTRDLLTPGPQQEQLRARIADLESQLAAHEPFDLPLPRPAADLRVEMKRLRATVLRLQVVAADADADRSRARETARRAEDTSARAIAEVSALERTNQNLQRNLSRLRASAAAAEESVLKGRDARRILRQRIDDLTIARNTLETDLQSARTRLDTEEQGHDITRETLRTVALERDAMRSRYEDAKVVQDTLQAELADAQASRDALQQRLSLLISRLNQSPSGQSASRSSSVTPLSSVQTPPSSSPIAVYSTGNSSSDTSPRRSSPVGGSPVSSLRQSPPRSPLSYVESAVATTSTTRVGESSAISSQDMSTLSVASVRGHGVSFNREPPALLPSSRPTKLQRHAPRDSLPVEGLPGTYRVPRSALVRGAPRRALRMHADPATFFFGVDEPSGDVQPSFDRHSAGITRRDVPATSPSTDSSPSLALFSVAEDCVPVSNASAAVIASNARSGPAADNRGARGRVVTFADGVPVLVPESGGTPLTRSAVPATANDGAGDADLAWSPSPSSPSGSSSSYAPSERSDTPHSFVSIPGARGPVNFLASEVDPWPVVEVSRSFRGGVDVDWVLKQVPIRGWLFPTRVPHVTGDPRLLTWSAISALYTTQPWDSMTITVKPLTFDPLDEVFVPLVALYGDFVHSRIKALWEGTHHLAIPARGELDADLAAYVKRRKDRRSHMGTAWRMILTEIVDLMHRGYCDLDILLDPFFFHLAPRIKAREWHPVEDPRLPGSLVGSLAALDRADPWRLQYRADIHAHPAYGLPRLRDKFLRAPRVSAVSP